MFTLVGGRCCVTVCDRCGGELVVGVEFRPGSNCCCCELQELRSMRSAIYNISGRCERKISKGR